VILIVLGAVVVGAGILHADSACDVVVASPKAAAPSDASVDVAAPVRSWPLPQIRP
jgi:hypothetical protein